MPTKTDNGRVYIPKHLREKYGERYKIVDSGEGLLLVPVSEDPLDDLRDEWSDVDASLDEMLEGARAEAVENAGRSDSRSDEKGTE